MVYGTVGAVWAALLMATLALPSGLAADSSEGGATLVERQEGLIICNAASGYSMEPRCDESIPVRPGGTPHLRMAWDIPLEGLTEMYFEMVWEQTTFETANEMMLSVCRPTFSWIQSCVSESTSRGTSPNHITIQGATLDWLIEGAQETGKPIETLVWLDHDEHYVMQPYEITLTAEYA